MQRKKECIAMLLAGGQGSRLYTLTHKTAKPAVSFGGKYRIIDFPLSNCANSGLDTVGVLTQYRPLVLNEYVGNGLPWDLSRYHGGVSILPPYQAQGGGDWYKGTANAIYQNREFIERYSPDYVLILSGDHIYKMDYSRMLDYHKEKGADCTIAVKRVPIEEASRFGIMSVKEDGSIYKFTEKPKEPDSDLASMGIYIFSRKKLFEYLEADEADKDSANDFGKNVIPAMLSAGERMFAYNFEGYWKDVGTISSLWEANMDLLSDSPALSLHDKRQRIYFRSNASAPEYIGESAEVENSIITEGCEIYGSVRNSVIGADVYVGEGAVVEDSVIMSGTVIKPNARVMYSMVDSRVTIGEGATVGAPRSEARGIAVVGADVVISDRQTVADGEMISE